MSDKLQLPPSDQIYQQAMARSAEINRQVARERIARALDLAVLKPTATREDVRKAAALVEKEGIASLCVAPCNVTVARRITTRVTAVIGFPHGNTTPAVKLAEAALAVGHGATELDVVINYGRFLEGRERLVHEELTWIVHTVRKFGVPVKAILETCYYNGQQLWNACQLCVKCGVDFVKTSTGYAAGGATPEAVRVMLEAVAGKAQVKASGGIKTYADAAMYLDLGCTRLGAGRYEELLP
jgi:deoxyribose-phosphate aldolase